MKKYGLLLLLCCLTFLNCEKDDICVESTTPNLILRFYDFQNDSIVKQVSSLTVWAKEKSELYSKKPLDSIAIPLDISNDNTTYLLTSGTITDTIQFSYDRKDVFVSRTCGYKTIFENIQIESNTGNWIKQIEIINPIIENETASHIHLLH